MIKKYASSRMDGLWFGVAFDNGEQTETIFNSAAVAQCRKFIRRAQRLSTCSLFIDRWHRTADGLPEVLS